MDKAGIVSVHHEVAPVCFSQRPLLQPTLLPNSCNVNPTHQLVLNFGNEWKGELVRNHDNCRIRIPRNCSLICSLTSNIRRTWRNRTI